jgi:hypothetical protein
VIARGNGKCTGRRLRFYWFYYGGAWVWVCAGRLARGDASGQGLSYTSMVGIRVSVMTIVAILAFCSELGSYVF